MSVPFTVQTSDVGSNAVEVSYIPHGYIPSSDDSSKPVIIIPSHHLPRGINPVVIEIPPFCDKHNLSKENSELVEEALELADIFRKYGPGYRASHNLTSKQKRVMGAIESCRTELLGGHVYQCDHCGHEEKGYNSCRDRHCPKCQGKARHKWVENRLDELLQVRYFHVVFTLPHKLFELGMANQKFLYDLLFKAASDTLQDFAKNEKHLGAKLGFYGILHTWGQTLWFHPHVHFIVPAGGLTADGKSWIKAKSNEKFLFPMIPVSQVFRGKFIDGLKKAWNEGQLELQGELEQLKDEIAFKFYLDSLVSKKWEVYAKTPFESPERVVKYIGAYTHRVAISNSRLISMEGGEVSFWYKDYKDNATWKIKILPVEEFIKRFLWHILPEGFHKIRYFGFLANGKREKNIQLIRSLLPKQDSDKKEKEEKEEEGPFLCPVCQKGQMICVADIARPPSQKPAILDSS